MNRLYNSRRLLLIILALLAGYAPAAAEAQEPERCPFSAALDRDSITYGEKAGNMLARGALNAGFGWTEILMNTNIEAKRGGNIFTGLVRGVGQSITRTANGFGEMFTFWTPKVGDDYITFANDSPLDMHNDEFREINRQQPAETSAPSPAETAPAP